MIGFVFLLCLLFRDVLHRVLLVVGNCGIFLKRWEYQTLNCLLRNLCAGQEATVRNGHGTMVWFQTGKGVHHGCISLPCLFTLNAEYIIWNAGLDETQAGIRIAERNITNLRYVDDTTRRTKSAQELKNFLMMLEKPLFSPWWRWKKRVKKWLKTQHSKN